MSGSDFTLHTINENQQYNYVSTSSDSSSTFGCGDNNASDYKIILLLMIKNESKIIERCLSSALNFVDAISILDTGSTDDTVSICDVFLKNNNANIPYKITTAPWTNFGINRTISFQHCKEFCSELGWDKEKTFALAIDADMNIVIKDKKVLINELEQQGKGKETGAGTGKHGFLIIQRNPSIMYYNIRFLRMDRDWKCVGATHEYWDVGPGGDLDRISDDIIYIDDKNDGGCKSDKYERDARMLENELLHDPTNVRAMFYLAQTYKDLGRLEDSIKYYKKRIDAGGWHEEVWYSHYMICQLYLRLGDEVEAGRWCHLAYKYYPLRSEAIFLMLRHYRINNNHLLAYYYYKMGKDIKLPKHDGLFIENHVYNGLFEYEYTIISYYIDVCKGTGLKATIDYINNGLVDNLANVWNNMIHYVEPLCNYSSSEYGKFLLPNYNEFSPSSCSVIVAPRKKNGSWMKRQYIMNVRYVNYILDGKGNYPTRDGKNVIKTINGCVFLNKSHFMPISDVRMMTDDEGNCVKKFDCNVLGYEDVRLFSCNDEVYFSATCRDMTESGRHRIVIGKYDELTGVMSGAHVIEPPSNTECEKNWLVVPNCHAPGVASEQVLCSEGLTIIYDWYPMKIGTIANSKLHINKIIQTPHFFSKMRGSTNPIEYDGSLWCVGHIVHYDGGRKYFHVLIKLNKETFAVESYSTPFCFKKRQVEYCLGFVISDGRCIFFFSENDSCPGMVELPIESIKFMNV